MLRTLLTLWLLLLVAPAFAQQVLLPTSNTDYGVAQTVSASAVSSLVVKATKGNLYSAYATNETATAGRVMVFDATSAPADGAVTPKICVALPASGTGSIQWAPSPPAVFLTGIVVVVSSNASCYTKTTGVITAFISGVAP